MNFSCSIVLAQYYRFSITVLINGLVSLQGVWLNRLSVRCPTLAGVMCTVLECCKLPPSFGCATDGTFDMQARWTKVCSAAVSHEQTIPLQGNRWLCLYLLASITTLWELYFCLSIRILSPFTHDIFFFLFVFLKCTLEYIMLWLHFFFCLRILHKNRTVPTRESSQNVSSCG